jgi:hypothetical protein
MAQLTQQQTSRRTQSTPQPQRADRRSVEYWLDLDPTGGLAYHASSQGWAGPSDEDEDEDD